MHACCHRLHRFRAADGMYRIRCTEGVRSNTPYILEVEASGAKSGGDLLIPGRIGTDLRVESNVAAVGAITSRPQADSAD